MNQTSSLFRLASSLSAAAAVAVLTACGGGGGDSAPSTPEASDGFGPANVAGCPRGQLADVWITRRLPCLGAGQALVNGSAGATGARADRAYILAQTAQDTALANILGTGRSRWFKHYMCVRNAPEGISNVLLAGDVGVALGLGSAIRPSYLPAGVSGSAVNIGGGREAAMTAMSCDPARHPLIVNYETGRVESINRDALAALTVYDL